MTSMQAANTVPALLEFARWKHAGSTGPASPARPPSSATVAPIWAADADVRTWTAADGTSVLVRPIAPDDFELEREFVAGLSRRTRYQRLMSARTPQATELRRWTRIDPEREAALIATVNRDGRERQIGVARYAIDDVEDEAEFAIVIDDEWQGRGLGAHLLFALIDLARRSGLQRLCGTTFSENTAMLGLARRLGFKRSLEPGAGFLTGLSLELLADA